MQKDDEPDHRKTCVDVVKEKWFANVFISNLNLSNSIAQTTERRVFMKFKGFANVLISNLNPLN